MKASITAYNPNEETPELTGVYHLNLFLPEAIDKNIDLEVDQVSGDLKLCLQIEPKEARLLGEMLILFAEP